MKEEELIRFMEVLGFQIDNNFGDFSSKQSFETMQKVTAQEIFKAVKKAELRGKIEQAIKSVNIVFQKAVGLPHDKTWGVLNTEVEILEQQLKELESEE